VARVTISVTSNFLTSPIRYQLQKELETNHRKSNGVPRNRGVIA